MKSDSRDPATSASSAPAPVRLIVAGGAVAADLMTAKVICVAHDASVSSAARLLLDSEVGAAPVLSTGGDPVGMVSDGDLLGRRTEAGRRAWWLAMLAADRPVLEVPTAQARSVHEVMTAPLISVGPKTSASEIARLLRLHRIKRLPVVEDARLIGLVSRADLLSLVESSHEAAGPPPTGLETLLESLFASHRRLSPSQQLAAVEAAGPLNGMDADGSGQSEISAETLRALVASHATHKADAARQAKRAAELERQRKVKALLDEHVSDAFWRELIDHARRAAMEGDSDLMILRFPAAACSDGGRMINNAEAGWAGTLRGEPAELYDRWAKELKPKGLRLHASVVSFDKGMMGDCGLYLSWGE